MNPLVLAVYRKKNPLRAGSSDSMVYHKDSGFLACPKTLFNGQVLWAVSVGRENKSRLEMRYCEATDKIVFPEQFVKRKRVPKPWSVVKQSIRNFFKGKKPADISWKRAKALIKAADERRKAETESGAWPSMLSHRAGSGAFSRV